MREMLRVAAGALLAVVLSMVLLRMGAGSETESSELDNRLSAGSRAALRERAAEQRRVTPGSILHTLRRGVQGDFGSSITLGRPVSELIAERARGSITLVLIAAGVSICAGLIAALISVQGGAGVWFDAGGTVLLAIPVSVLALASARLGAPLAVALTLAILPYGFRYTAAILKETAASLHVLTARARGLSRARISLFHILRPSLPELCGVGTITLTAAIGGAIPMEALAGSPGLGQLAWQAALGRDLPLVAGLAAVIGGVTLAAGSLAEIARAGLQWRMRP